MFNIFSTIDVLFSLHRKVSPLFPSSSARTTGPAKQTSTSLDAIGLPSRTAILFLKEIPVEKERKMSIGDQYDLHFLVVTWEWTHRT
jgi:hypothetical protein